MYLDVISAVCTVTTQGKKSTTNAWGNDAMRKTNMQTGSHTHRQLGRQADRQTDTHTTHTHTTHTHIHTHTQRSRQRER
jgi:hypothetical protein